MIKKYIIYIVGIVTLLATSCKKKSSVQQKKETTLRVITYNIRRDYDKTWRQNRQRIVNQLQLFRPDFINVQEALHRQVKYLENHIGNMKFIGQGRVDGKQKGEYEAIFYNAQRFELINDTDSTMWISQTPSKPGKGWDAAWPRVVTWGKFRDKKSGKELYIFNTHLDNEGDTAQVKGAQLLTQTIKNVAGDIPSMITGDFNATEDSKPYQIMTAGGFRDSRRVSKAAAAGPKFTYVGNMDVLDTTAHRQRIDYLFVNKGFKVKRTAVISNFNHYSFLSDHLPYLGDLQFGSLQH